MKFPVAEGAEPGPAVAELRELIDDPATSGEQVCATLSDQARINRRFGPNSALLRHALPFLRHCLSNPVRVLDLSCGGGDHCRLLVDALRRQGRPVEAVAMDLSERVLACARRWSRDYPEIRFVRADARAPCWQPSSFDLVLFASTLHHLQPAEAVAAIRDAYELSRGLVIVSDVRQVPGLGWLLSVLPAVPGLSPVSRHDAAISLRRAFTPAQLARLAEAAQVGPFRLYRHRWLRMVLAIP